MSQQIYSLPPLATWVSYLAIPRVPHPPEHVSNAAHYAMAEIRGKIIREEIIREEPIRLAEAKARLGRLAELSRKGKTVRFIARGELIDLDWAGTEQAPAVRTARRDRSPTQGSSRPGAAGSATMVVGWEAIMKAVEQEKWERWMEFRDRYGDWGRDVALWLGRTVGRMRLQELAGKVGGVD